MLDFLTTPAHSKIIICIAAQNEWATVIRFVLMDDGIMHSLCVFTERKPGLGHFDGCGYKHECLEQ